MHLRRFPSDGVFPTSYYYFPPPPSSRAHILHIGSAGAIGWEGNDQGSIILAYKYWSSVLVDKAYATATIRFRSGWMAPFLGEECLGMLASTSSLRSRLQLGEICVLQADLLKRKKEKEKKSKKKPS